MTFARNFYQEEMWQKGYTYVSLSADAGDRLLCWNCGSFTLGANNEEGWTCRYCHFSHRGTADKAGENWGTDFCAPVRADLAQARARVAVLERALKDLVAVVVAVPEEGQDLDLRAATREAVDVLHGQEAECQSEN